MQLLPFPVLYSHRRRMLIHVLSLCDSRQLWELLEALQNTSTQPERCLGLLLPSSQQEPLQPQKKTHKL